MKLVRLSPEDYLEGFDCGDEDLNEFLIEDAKGFLDKRIAATYLLKDDERIVAYFCLLNDKIRPHLTRKVNLRVADFSHIRPCR